MTWEPGTVCDNEQSNIAPHVVRYLQGRCLDLGCGQQTVWPTLIGMDNAGTFRHGTDGMIRGDIADLSLFADNSIDGIFSSHAIEDFPEDDIPALFREWTRVLKVGGYLVLYVPSANLYPKVGTEGANVDHKWNIFPGDLEKHLRAATVCGWEQVECEERGQMNEYSLFEVYRKRDDGEFVRNVWQRNPDGQKRALVIRYGAIGDQMIASSILPGLKKQGYHVTYNTTPDGQSLLMHDPHVDDWILQAKDYVPNVQLGPYWEQLYERYDHIVNLCESIEGLLLGLPGRLNHMYSHETRKRVMGSVNYLERTHDIAAIPYDFAPRFYATPDERQWALRQMAAFARGNPVITWAINGSSHHKTYPWTHVVIGWLLERTPCHVVITADEQIGGGLQAGILDTLKESDADLSRVHGMAGKWPIRDSLAFAQVSDCVVGPETGLLNAVSFEAMPKVIYLSHSSVENLTKHWINTITLEPDTHRAPCYPCNRMHYTWDHCFQDKRSHAAFCAAAITPERVLAAIAGAFLGLEQAA